MTQGSTRKLMLRAFYERSQATVSCKQQAVQGGLLRRNDKQTPSVEPIVVVPFAPFDGKLKKVEDDLIRIGKLRKRPLGSNRRLDRIEGGSNLFHRGSGWKGSFEQNCWQGLYRKSSCRTGSDGGAEERGRASWRSSGRKGQRKGTSSNARLAPWKSAQAERLETSMQPK